ncbi:MULTISPECIES: cytoplasmic protein [Streptococcus]|uniref:Cytoplasmic protein n=1 Tax=Streptococcus caledonicus TaxID=2614158 RepID=A0ABW0UGM0_9STRE
MSLTNVKREKLVIKPEVIGTCFYVGLGRAPRQVDGKQGKYERHILMTEKHGELHVITPASSTVFEPDVEVKIVEPLFYPDGSLHGRDVSRVNNVLAKKLEVVKGGK